MKCHSGVFFQLSPNLVADLQDGCRGIRKVEIVHEHRCKLVWCCESLVQIPKKDILQSIWRRRIRKFVGCQICIDAMRGVIVRKGKRRGRCEGRNVEIYPDRNQCHRERCLRIGLLVHPSEDVRPHPTPYEGEIGKTYFAYRAFPIQSLQIP